MPQSTPSDKHRLLGESTSTKRRLDCHVLLLHECGNMWTTSRFGCPAALKVHVSCALILCHQENEELNRSLVPKGLDDLGSPAEQHCTAVLQATRQVGGCWHGSGQGYGWDAQSRGAHPGCQALRRYSRVQ